MTIRATLIEMRALLLAAIAGCGFAPIGAATSDGAQAAVDAAHGSDGPQMTIDARAGMDGSATAAPCYAPDLTGIVLCLELDDMPLTQAKDGSGLGHDATVSGATAVTRTVPANSQAAVIALDVDIETADSADFNLQDLTLMAWVEPTATPAIGNTYGMVYKYGQYWMGIDDSGDLECLMETSTGTHEFDFTAVPLNMWSLAGCTYDGTQVCGTVQTGASGNKMTSCMGFSGALNGDGGIGILVGSRWDAENDVTYQHLIGAIDSVRIFSRFMTDAQICTEGGRTGC